MREWPNGMASASQAEGCGFESRLSLQEKKLRFCLGSVRAVTAVALVFYLSRPSATLVSHRVGRDLLQ